MTHPLSAPALIAMLALAPSARAQRDAVVLLREGEVLPNGWTAETLGRPSIANDGTWAAWVDTDRPPGSPSRVAVVNGAVALAEGQTLPNGEVVAALLDVELDATGALAAIYTVVPAPGATTPAARLQLGANTVLRSGDSLLAAGLPPGAQIYTLRDVELALPFATVHVVIEAPNLAPPTLEALLRYDLTQPNAPQVTVLARQGALFTGAPGPVTFVHDPAAVATDGSTYAFVDVDVAGVAETVGLRDGVAHFLDGVASPLGGALWQHPPAPQVACGPGAALVVSSTIRRPAGNLDGVVVTDGPILAVEGLQVLGGHGLTVGNFASTAVAITAAGAPAYKLPTTTGSVVMFFDDLVLQSGVSRASGALIASTKVSTPASLAVSPNGRLVLTEVQLVGGLSAFALVERYVGQVTACPPNPNSTGVPGRLAGVGTSFVSVNDLTIVASDLPQHAFGYLACSRTPTFVANAGGSSGNLCLGGTVGRFAAQVQSSGAAGAIATTVDLSALPQPNGTIAAVAGQTWGFQLWHRDAAAAGQATSNFTEALAIPLW